jgi:hypothetical protein
MRTRIKYSIIKKEEMGKTSRTHGRDNKCRPKGKILVGKSEGKANLGDLRLRRRIILNRILKIRFICLSFMGSGGLLCKE